MDNLGILTEDFTEFQRLTPKYIMALSSTAHTYGNVVATLQHWALNIFSKGLFKTVHVNSRIAHSQILKTPQTHLKKEKPMILFSPRVDYDEDVFLKGTLLTEKRGGLHTTGTNGVVDLNPFFYDMNNEVSMVFTQARRCMFMDVIVQFDSLIEQMNYMDFLIASLDWNRPFDIWTWLEAFISKELLDTLGEISGIPVHDPNDGSVTDFLNYMNSHSIYPVTYKLMGSTGKEEFYRYYHTNILTTLTNLGKNDGENVNHVMTNFNITFTIRAEFWSPSLLYLMSDKVNEVPVILPTDATLIPIFADVFILDDLNLSPGWEVYGHASYILDKVHDTVGYDNLIQQKIRDLIAYHIENGMPLCNIIDIRVRQMGKLILEGRDYTINYATHEITFNNTEWGFDTYTIIVAINVLYVNTLIKELNSLK